MARIIPLENDHYYHIYNRGADKRRVFMDKYDFIRFLKSMREFNRVESSGGLYGSRQTKKHGSNSGRTALYAGSSNKNNTKRPKMAIEETKVFGGSTAHQALVKILCYSLLPNHYHMILEQIRDGGISEFMKRLGGYTWYFNKKHKRTGALFQGKFKSAHIKNDTKLCWLSAYVNCNVEIHRIARADNWIWSSYLDFIGKRSGGLCNKKAILKNFINIEEYILFCKEVIEEARRSKTSDVS